MPEGWQFWVAARRKPRKKLSFYIKSAGGILGLAATVAGAYFAFRSQPATFGMADWVHQANASCEQDFGPLKLSLFDGLLSSKSAVAGQNNSSAQQLTNGVQSWITAEGDLSKQVGDLSALQTPHDGASRVRAVLNSGNSLVTSMDTFANAMQAGIGGTGVTPAQYAAAKKDGNNVLAALLAWRQALKAAGLNHCAFWVDHPGSTPATLAPAPAPSPSAPVTTPPGPVPPLDPGEQQLAGLLDPADLSNCTGRPSLEVGGVVAAINCQTGAPGPTLRPLVIRFSDLAAANSWFSGNTANFVDRSDCAAGYRVGTWTHYGIPAGPLGCAYISGDFRMVWVIDSSLIGVIADGTNGNVMYSWWTHWCYITGTR